MRVLFVLGGLFVVVGLLWFGQGIGIIGGSFMTGQALWAVIGGGCIGLGGYLVRVGLRWRQADPGEEEDA